MEDDAGAGIAEGCGVAANNPATSSDPSGLCPSGNPDCPGYYQPGGRGYVPATQCDRACGGQGPALPSGPAGCPASEPGCPGHEQFLAIQAHPSPLPGTFLTAGPPPCAGRMMNLVGCNPETTYGWGLTDTAGLGVTGAGAFGKFYSGAGMTLGDPSTTAEEKRLAGQRLSYLSRNQGWRDAAALGRDGRFAWGGGGTLAVLGGVLTAVGLHEAGDPWWKAITKSVVVTGFSFGGALVGGIAGAGGGALIPGADLTGVPEAAGAIVGAAGGGYIGGDIGFRLSNWLLGP